MLGDSNMWRGASRRIVLPRLRHTFPTFLVAVIPILLSPYIINHATSFIIHSPANKPHVSHITVSTRSFQSISTRASTSSPSIASQDDASNRSFLTPTIVQALDVEAILQLVASHAGTRRGHRAIMSTIDFGHDLHPPLKIRRAPSQRTAWLSKGIANTKSNRQSQQYIMRLAASPTEARRLYDRLEQGMLGLQGTNNATYPPLYAAESSPWDSDQVDDSDDDEWLEFTTAEDFELHDILKAEQVVKRLLRVSTWARDDNTQQWMPFLADIGCRMDHDSLQALYASLENVVKVVRVRTALDVSAKSSFVFQLNGEAFPSLSQLRTREGELLQQQRMTKNAQTGKGFGILQAEIEAKEREIKDSLAYSILAFADIVNEAFNHLAELDIIFAKAAFALQAGGRIPQIDRHCCFEVKQFVHPLLLDSTLASPVPVDLVLGDRRALIVSGSNGGGKTLSLKSFGAVAIMARLGIAIPSRDTSAIPRVGFFHDLLTSIGDRQDLLRGTSTYAAQLETYSSFIQRLSEAPADGSVLILLDELGGGTESNAGGAIAQAILERLLVHERCAIVATTHSSRLKALSFEDETYECAAVLVSEAGDYPQPTFQLQYGVIGESQALGAASRCSPALPDDVLSRASELLFHTPTNVNGDSGERSADYSRAMSKSLARQLELATEAKTAAAKAASDTAVCQRAILSLAESYERHFGLLENRVHQCYQSLKADKTGSLELAGATLNELRLVKAQVRQATDVLRERGLKLLPWDHPLSAGESVVIVCEGEWDGVTATVAPDGTQKDQEYVLVIPFFNPIDGSVVPLSDDSTAHPQPMAFLRRQLAIWDYDSVWQSNANDNNVRIASVSDAKRRVTSVLSSLRTADDGDDRSLRFGSKGIPSTAQTFTSSRERKAQTKGKGRRKK